jgi:predicted glycogen debranching enzyme
MAYIEFDKEKLINLSYSLSKELLRTNRRGAYASSTLIRCNTRKYHGLLIAPQPAIDDELHVLLSAVDPTVIQHDSEFNLGIHQYPGGVFSPKGHKYVRELRSDPVPEIIYRVGGVVLSVQSVFSRDADRILLKYTLVDCHSPTTLRLKPYLAFRQRHKLSKANEWVEKKYEEAANGVRFRLYQGYSPLFLQFSKKVDYVHVPDWYYNIEYVEEQKRGYEYSEDLFVPGYFEFPIKKGESVILSAGLEVVAVSGIKRSFNTEVQRRIPRDSFENCLLNSAQQFISRRDKKTEIIAGYPWFGSWGRDTFISLPGLMFPVENYKDFHEVMKTAAGRMRGPLFPNNGSGRNADYSSADAPLWYVWAVQKFAEQTSDYDVVKKNYYKHIKTVVNGYRKGTEFNIHMAENGLIWQGEAGKALTWMDAVVAGKPVTPRAGFAVEINALWYNALNFTAMLAAKFGEDDFADELNDIAAKAGSSFVEIFWDEKRGYLADYSTGDYTDWAIRPNMIIAASMPFSPVDVEVKQKVLKKAKDDLLTVRGLRSLSPRNPDYKGQCAGNQQERDLAYHQGTVWPWLFGHFTEGWLKVHGKSGVRKPEWYLEQFEEVMTEHGIGTISEIYDGDPPHEPRGCISQAWSVAEVLRAKMMIEKVKKEGEL